MKDIAPNVITYYISNPDISNDKLTKNLTENLANLMRCISYYKDEKYREDIFFKYKPSQLNIDFLIYYLIVIYYKLSHISFQKYDTLINKKSISSIYQIEWLHTIIYNISYGCNYFTYKIKNIQPRIPSQKNIFTRALEKIITPDKDYTNELFVFEKVTKGGAIRRKSRSRSKSKRTKSRSRIKSKSRK